jgi:orotate phosphoribosyltransferase
LLALPDVLLSGHFQLLSGRHSDRFLAFSRIAKEPGAIDLLAKWLAPSLAPHRPDLVLAPSSAGVSLGWALARQLGCPLQLASLDDEGRPAGLIGEADIADRAVLLVNDVLTTGKGLEALAQLVRERGAHVAAASWFLTRSPLKVAEGIDAPTVSIGTIELPSWRRAECRLCASGELHQEALDLN